MPGNRMRRPDEPEPGLVVAVWPDGRLVAGRDSLLGGAPYREGRVEPAIVARSRERIASAVLNVSRRLVAVPDAASRHVFVALDGPDGQLGSAIELFERDPRLVATDRGIELLDGRDRAEVIAEQPAEHRAFRAAWAECVAVFDELARDATVPLDDLDPVRFVWRAP